MFNCCMLASRNTRESCVTYCSLRVEAVSVGLTYPQAGKEKEEIFTVDRTKKPHQYFFL